MNGFLLVDKPAACTSFNVVSLCRKVFQQTHVGHSGTLDPFATGLLIIAVGEALKLLEYLPSAPKEYIGTAMLGATSPTRDTEGEIMVTPGADILATSLDRATIERVIREHFLGEILQVPPAHSAVKVRGVPAYVRARRGENLVLPPRPATIYDFQITEFLYPVLSFRVKVSSGTYIRSLLHDLGQMLGTGAYLTALRRTQIAQFSLEDAVTTRRLEELLITENDVDSSLLHSLFIPLELAVSHLPRLDITQDEHERLSHGLFIPTILSDNLALETDDKVLAAFLDNRLVGVLEFVGMDKLKFRKKLNL